MKATRNTLFILTLLVSFVFCDNNIKTQQTWVYDYESDLDSAQIKLLSKLFAEHEKKTSNEIAVLTTTNYGNDTSILFFSVNEFRKLGLGKKGIDNGVLIVFSGANREARITTGYGTEKVLKDEIADRIMDSVMIPHFRKGEVFKGIWEGSNAIVKFLEQPENKIN